MIHAADPMDAIVVGGSYAGMAAALQLGRARRRVLVIDRGLPRNRSAASSHGFLGHDGDKPQDFIQSARKQLLLYPTILWLNALAVRANGSLEQGFGVFLEDGTALRAARLVLAAGVADQLRPIEGLEDLWGSRVFHCPYCHAYELGASPRLGVLAGTPLEASIHQAKLVAQWGKTTFFTQGLQPDAQQSHDLRRAGIDLEHAGIARVNGPKATVVLQGGRSHALDGLFVLSSTRLNSEIPLHLGCVIDEGPLGSHVRVDDFQRTSVSGVFACGDLASPRPSIALAVASGSMAGAAAHQSFLPPPNH